LNEKELREQTEEWDSLLQGEQHDIPLFLSSPQAIGKAKEKDNYHDSILKNVEFLSAMFYDSYHHNGGRPFLNVLCEWIDQFDESSENVSGENVLLSERRIAFLLLRWLIFLNTQQVETLTRCLWSIVKKELATIIAASSGIGLREVFANPNFIRPELDRSLFTGLTDSARLREFRYCFPPGMDQLTIDSIKLFTNPVNSGNGQGILDLNSQYQDRTNLFILEEFSGSGTTMVNTMNSMISHYHFQRLYFCPLVCFAATERRFQEIAERARTAGKEAKLIMAMRLGEEYSLAPNESVEKVIFP
jgi:hypothetical protein